MQPRVQGCVAVFAAGMCRFFVYGYVVRIYDAQPRLSYNISDSHELLNICGSNGVCYRRAVACAVRSGPCVLDDAYDKRAAPVSAYIDSIDECLAGGKAVPQWYMAVADGAIVGGLGVIENDFHERRDLAPNVCAVFTDEKHRCRGIAGALLDLACRDMKARGIGTLYLVTDHVGFYERYGWSFLCHVKCDDGSVSRMYTHVS